MYIQIELSISDDYNAWANIYDENENKTRDLEKKVAQKLLSNYSFETLIELGCGTGKNTEWLLEKTHSILALDFSEKMLEKAKNKIVSDKVQFFHRNINSNWDLPQTNVSAVTCSLTLEHIENLNHIFKEASSYLEKGGLFYLCELHPFKQYAGSKARFPDNEKLRFLETFTHNISDYLMAAKMYGMEIDRIDEWCDDDDRSKIPRLISFIFKK